MKSKSIQTIILTLAGLALLITSCNKPSQDIYTVVPDNAAIVGSFNPGKLIEKAGAKDIEFIKREIGDDEFAKALFENPDKSGININEYSGFFMFGSNPRYIGIVMPLKKQKDFENFLEQLGKEMDMEFLIEKADNFHFTKEGGNIIAWNKSLVLSLQQVGGWGDETVFEKITALFSLEDENCVLSEKDFKSFLSEQKDINVWATSNQLDNLTGGNTGMFNILGAINNNYAHIFLEFNDGAIVLSSNLKLNPDFRKNLDRFNIIDKNAEKDILKMLPAKDLVMAGNFRLNSEKMIEIMKTFNSGNNEILENLQKETGKSPDEILKSLQGNIAFSINGIKHIEDPEMGESDKMPVIVAALQLNDEDLFKYFISMVQKQEGSIEEKDGYYILRADMVPFYLGVKNKVVIMSNELSYMTEILSEGKIKNNVMDLDISKTLVDNPICFYLNLDKDSYSETINDYISSEMDQGFAMGLSGFGTSLKSLTLSGNIEKSELTVEFKDKSVNSLKAILLAIDK
ncbi:MAG: DUF4836 family protein [Bacteroidales bacterium]|nr:DUF4836 family protein [Bacteroidales bacterium]MCB8999943.1 DUF4836 family protein [Bacteroidales bacterium]MCB9012606.1 DUF4836 family protein [Bacteroidales bacterium]